MSNTIVQYKETPFNEMQAYARYAAQSKLFGIDNDAQAISLMLVAQSQGLHPATAFMDYHVVKGRPTLKAEAMLARHQADGGVFEWLYTDENKAIARVSHPTKSPAPIEVTWTVERAQKIGLTSNPSWKNYPAAMLRARVIAESIRAVNPSVLRGFYASEEAENFEDKPAENLTHLRAVKTIESEVIDHKPTPEAAPAVEKASSQQLEDFNGLESQLNEDTYHTLWDWIIKKYGLKDKKDFENLSIAAMENILKITKAGLEKQQEAALTEAVETTENKGE